MFISVTIFFILYFFPRNKMDQRYESEEKVGSMWILGMPLSKIKRLVLCDICYVYMFFDANYVFKITNLFITWMLTGLQFNDLNYQPKLLYIFLLSFSISVTPPVELFIQTIYIFATINVTYSNKIFHQNHALMLKYCTYV